VGCRTRRSKTELVRIVRRPDGTVLLDESGSLDGRGAYLCPAAACWTTALHRNSLQRALRGPVPAALKEQLEQGLETAGHVMAGRLASQAMLGGPHGT
jgi:predicted RNA-binding protein YlxR (DUF448 family)